MKVDFFSSKCQTITKEISFGICDNDDSNPAFLDFDNPTIWIAKISNQKSKEIIFTAIDNCVEIKRKNNEMENRCDTMLEYENNIVFIELKNKRADWIEEGINQIETTLKVFIENNDEYFKNLKTKRAFVTNRKHPNFHTIENETMKRFFYTYKVRLNIQAEILIK